jgi:hypothetical protein
VRVTERGEIPQLPAKAGIRWGKWIHSPSFQPKQAGGGDLHSFQPRQQEGAGRFHPASSQSRPGGGGALPIRQQRMANAKRMHSKYPSFQQRQQACNSSRRGGGSYNPSHSSFGNVAGDSQPIHAANVAATLAGDSQPQSQPQLIWQCSSSCGIVAAKGASL